MAESNLSSGAGATSTLSSISVVEKLEGSRNYSNWKFRVRLVLEERDLWSIVAGDDRRPAAGVAISGPSAQPASSSSGSSAAGAGGGAASGAEETGTTQGEADTSLDAWKRRDRKAYILIATLVGDSQLNLIKGCGSSKEAWDKLTQAYESSAPANRMLLNQRLKNLSLKSGEKMQDYINRGKEIAEQLEGAGAPVSSDIFILTLLAGLPETYEPLVMSLSSMDNLEVDVVCNKLLHEELRRQNKEKESKDSAFSTGLPGNKSGGRFKQKQQQKQQQNKDNKQQQKKGPKCFYCGKLGHIKRDCFKFQEEQKSKGNNQGTGSGPSTEERASAAHDFLFMASPSSSSHLTLYWYVDSAATQHMTCQREWLHNFEPIPPRQVILGDDHILEATGKGQVKLLLETEGGTSEGGLTEVLYVPDLAVNLLSVRRLVEKEAKVEFDAGACVIKNRSGAVIGQTVMDNNLYRLKAKTLPVAEVAAAVSTVDAKTLHERFGHLGEQNLEKLVKQELVDGLPKLESFSVQPCDGCLAGKQHRHPFSTEEAERAKQTLQLIHTDLCGPMQTPSLNHALYFVTFIDDFSRYTSVYFLQSKDQCLEKFLVFKAWAENQTERTIKEIRSDRGGEYLSHEFQKVLEAAGIRPQRTAPMTPQQNGVAERANRTIVESARSMLHGRSLPLCFWAEAVSTAVYLKNRSPTKAVKGMTPYEAWFGKKPSVGHLRVFGCKAFAHINAGLRRKLDAKSRPCVFIGYDPNSIAYRLYDPIDKKLIISRDVIFIESDSLYPTQVINQPPKPLPPAEVIITTEEKLPAPVVEAPAKQAEDLPMQQAEDPELSPQLAEELVDEDAVPMRRSGRSRRPPSEWWVVDPRTRGLATFAPDPATYSEALGSPDAEQWEQAIAAELESLRKNNTWVLAELPHGRKPVTCKWVLRIKRNPDGTVAKYKARLCARGFTQTKGIDYQETFAPVAKFPSFRVVFALAAALDWELHHMDVKTAFLNGELEEEIYMEQPEGAVEPGKEHLYCKLIKSLYGLKQSPRAWNQKLHQRLREMQFNRLEKDHSLYVWSEDEELVILATHVDDLIIASNSKTALAEFKEAMVQTFEMSDLGPVSFYLGMQVERDRARRELKLSQAHYVAEVLERFGMTECKPISTPMEVKTKLQKHEGQAGLEEVREYQRLVGSLMYLMVGTRPDIAFTVGALSRHLSNPGPEHWVVAKRVLRYLKGTANLCLTYSGGLEELVGYTDADWASDLDRYSTSGYLFILGGGAVSWASKRQKSIALSSTEAEYMALALGAKEAVWLRQLLEELQFPPTGPTLINVDNQSCIKLTKNPELHQQTKHIDIRYHFTRQHVEEGTIKVEFCPTKQMAADFLTKSVCQAVHQNCASVAGLTQPDFGKVGVLK
jgi:hypothetical protein